MLNTVHCSFPCIHLNLGRQNQQPPSPKHVGICSCLFFSFSCCKYCTPAGVCMIELFRTVQGWAGFPNSIFAQSWFRNGQENITLSHWTVPLPVKMVQTVRCIWETGPCTMDCGFRNQNNTRRSYKAIYKFFWRVMSDGGGGLGAFREDVCCLLKRTLASLIFFFQSYEISDHPDHQQSPLTAFTEIYSFYQDIWTVVQNI